MLDNELMTPPPPTPLEVLKVLVEVYGPPPNPDNPMQNTKQEAALSLAAQMYSQTLGMKDPMGKLALIWLTHHVSPYPSEEEAHLRLTAAEIFCQEIQQQLEHALENAA